MYELMIEVEQDFRAGHYVQAAEKCRTVIENSPLGSPIQAAALDKLVLIAWIGTVLSAKWPVFGLN